MKGGSPEKTQLVSQLRFITTNSTERMAGGTHSVFRYQELLFVGDEVFPPIFDLHAESDSFGHRPLVDVADIKNPVRC